MWAFRRCTYGKYACMHLLAQLFTKLRVLAARVFACVFVCLIDCVFACSPVCLFTCLLV